MQHGDRTEVGVRVTDTGIGMDPDVVPQLFEPFRQASEGLDRTYEGVGLGLTIVQRAVDAMNGRLDIDTTPGEGTAIIVWLPAAT
jgi:signal transduction histidine kinase